MPFTIRDQRWVRSFDGTRIGYCTWGRGDRVIVLSNGVSCTDSYWKYIINYFSPHYRIITWDYRGHGVSQTPQNKNEIAISSHARDLKVILERERIIQPVLGGFSMGVQVCLEFYRLFPGNCSGLLLLAGPPGRPLESLLFGKFLSKLFPAIFYPLGLTLKSFYQPLLNFFLHSPFIYPFCILSRMISPAASREDMQFHYHHISQMDPGLFLRMVKAMENHDARDVLAQIRVPTLVVAGARDIFTRCSAQEKMQKRIPHSELLKIPLGTHVVPLEHPEVINFRISSFLRNKVWTSSGTNLSPDLSA